MFTTRNKIFQCKSDHNRDIKVDCKGKDHNRDGDSIKRCRSWSELSLDKNYMKERWDSVMGDGAIIQSVSLKNRKQIAITTAHHNNHQTNTTKSRRSFKSIQTNYGSTPIGSTNYNPSTWNTHLHLQPIGTKYPYPNDPPSRSNLSNRQQRYQTNQAYIQGDLVLNQQWIPVRS